MTVDVDDLTPDQRDFLDKYRGQIQQEIAERFKAAGVEKVTFKQKSELTTDEYTAAESQSSTKGIGVLFFANFALGSVDASSDPGLLGGTSSQNTSAVFLGNLMRGNGLSGGKNLAFGVGEVASHELGHQFGFPAHRESLSWIRRLTGGGRDLMDEGQTKPVPGQPQYFNKDSQHIQNFVDDVNPREGSICMASSRSAGVCPSKQLLSLLA